MIDAPTRIEASNGATMVAEMDHEYRRDPERPISVNMRHVDAISRPGGALLANVLLTSLSRAKLKLIEPAKSPVKKLTYSGLGFAFAHRKGETSFTNLTEAELQLDKWRLPWTPARKNPEFDPQDAPEEADPAFFEKAHAAFVNPHATARRRHRRDVPYRVQGWLYSVLPPRAGGLDANGKPGFLEQLQELVYELVDNVAEHAWPADAPEPCSLVQVAVARGNDHEIRDRIWVVVLDTGPGIATTAVPKIGDVDLSREELLKGLMCGKVLQTNDRARGLGLPRVAKICGRWRDSRLQIFTENLRIQIDNGDIQSSTTTWYVKGTIIIARFATPPVASTTSNKR